MFVSSPAVRPGSFFAVFRSSIRSKIVFLAPWRKFYQDLCYDLLHFGVGRSAPAESFYISLGFMLIRVSVSYRKRNFSVTDGARNNAPYFPKFGYGASGAYFFIG